MLQFKEKYFKLIKCQANLGSLLSDRKCLSLGLLPEEATHSGDEEPEAQEV